VTGIPMVEKKHEKGGVKKGWLRGRKMFAYRREGGSKGRSDVLKSKKKKARKKKKKKKDWKRTVWEAPTPISKGGHSWGGNRGLKGKARPII